MKKLVLTTLAIAGISGAAFAQGYVNYGAPGTDVIAATNTATYSGLSAALGGGAANPGAANPASGITAGSASGNIYYFELLYSTVDTTTPTTLADLSNNWTPSGLMWLDKTVGGTLGNTSTATTAAEIDPSYSSGPMGLMLVGWSANLGTTWTSVLPDLGNWGTTYTPLANSYLGLSFVGNLTALSTSAINGSVIFFTSQANPGGISNPTATPLVLNELQAVPEPGTLVLAALGGASLLLFRRKK